MKIIELPKQLSRDGFELTLIERKNSRAIYRQHLKGGNPTNDAFEVIIPNVWKKDREGKDCEPWESYPHQNQWGKKGWTFTTLEAARSFVI